MDIGNISDQLILITGGSGFLGTNLALQLSKRNKIILASRNNYLSQQALNVTGCEISPLDVSNIESVRDVIKKYKPDIVIHTAATKYVDLAEKNPNECIDINVLGSQNIARVSIENNVKILVGISTDKAALPVGNTYSLTKSLMERLFCNLNQYSTTKFVCVRFGNIAWSTGSVFCLWYQMMKSNNLILSTGPQMRRFFFSVDEASKLVMKSIEEIDKLCGKVLSKKMKSAMISDILNRWCEIYNCSWKKTDPRPEDKIDEYLIGKHELKNTYSFKHQDQVYFIIDFHHKYKDCLLEEYSTYNSEKLSDNEITNLIQMKPNNLI